jgi:coenzyme F420-reducing hydrogenase delta subunit
MTQDINTSASPEATVEANAEPDKKIEQPVSAIPSVTTAPGAKFEPIVLAFSCNWCSYTSADLAGVNRFFYPSNVRVIRFMCSGRIEPDFIMRAFECGVDGIIVSGCKLGECHYISGNEKAQRRLELTGKLLDLLGLGAERLGSVWISAAEGAKFASYMNEFVDKIRSLGPASTKK